MDTRCSGAILAGGRARRFGGRDKAALRVGDEAILEHQIAVLRRVVDVLFIVGNEPERFAHRGLPVVADRVRDAGALGGLHAALVAAPTDQVLVVACDMPFLNAAFLTYVRDLGRSADAAVPRTSQGYEPLCASYQRRCLAALERRLDAGLLKAADFLTDIEVREIGPEEIAPYDPHGSLFLNVNTPEEYSRAQELFRRRRS